MRILLVSLLLLVSCTVSLLLLDGSATAQDAAAPRSLVRARAQIAAQPVTFQIRNIRGVSDRPRSGPNGLCGTKPELFLRRLRARALDPIVKDDPTPVPSERRFDLRQKTGQPFPVENQGMCGSCWIFGAVAAYSGNSLLKNPSAVFNLSEQYVMECLLTQTGEDPCNGGWPETTLRFLQQHGTFAEADFPYRGGRAERRSPQANAPFRAGDFGYVNDAVEVPSVPELKKKLFTHGALVVAVRVGDAFQNYDRGVYNWDERAEPVNHAVTLIGWNDDDGGGVWILRNSWGPQWGEDGGYMRIRYNTSAIGYGAMYVEANTPDVLPPPIDSITERIRWWELNFPEFTKK